MSLSILLSSAPMVLLPDRQAFAQEMSNGADDFYRSDAVTIEKVTLHNKLGMSVVGNLFVPRALDRTTPAIIVGHPMGAVKEQNASLYTQKLVEQGFVTLSFDQPFRG